MEGIINKIEELKVNNNGDKNFFIKRLRNYDFTLIDENGRTILHHYIDEPVDECFIAIVLLSSKVFNHQDKDGNTPAHLSNDCERIKILNGFGANLNIKNYNGRNVYEQYVKDNL